MFTCRAFLFLLAIATVSISPPACLSSHHAYDVRADEKQSSHTFRPIGRGGGADPQIRDPVLKGGAPGVIQSGLSADCGVTSVHLR